MFWLKRHGHELRNHLLKPLTFIVLVLLCGTAVADLEGVQRVTPLLVAPLYLPKHDQIAVGPAKIVQIKMIIEEKEIEIAPDVFIHAFTFNGSVPGPMIVVHQDNYVELTLVNPTSSALLHNIDFHAATAHWVVAN